MSARAILARALPRDGFSEQQRGYAFGGLAALIWGGFLAMSARGVEAGLDAADLALLRYETAGLLLLPWLMRHHRRVTAKIGWGRAIVLALLAGPPFMLVGTSGFEFAPLAHSAVLQLGTVTLMGIVLAAIVTAERPGRARLIGLAIVVAGLAIAAGPDPLRGGSQAWKGDLLFVAAGLMWALFTVLQRHWQVEAMAATALVAVLSALVYAPTYLAIRGPATLAAAAPAMLITQAIFLGLFAGVIALFAFGRAVQHLGAGRASLFPALAPAVAILLGVPLTGEIPSIAQLAGLLVLTGGLMLALRR
ncbi:drug/metabolite transporter (DMT)-like permease [Sphingomonas zeicaulis]|uniref:DMT family transporter n=1 Tax=Sphingomonas zeicaulis TaxID=1632740 RepID=UPI003D1DEFCF